MTNKEPEGKFVCVQGQRGLGTERKAGHRATESEEECWEQEEKYSEKVHTMPVSCTGGFGMSSLPFSVLILIP